ncbi:hypothetical protein CYJ73_00545 [Gordonia terrae]|uniref:Uncharacterized protein n=1 Tax=Gordonia terrae TaxID=2055 RepID=A0A2I1RDK8_9ACTN|nr:hypothetical protein [Gordonia terrae]PKZ67221.1 hypothetical protein CYJ73_00545 [Gordonia terrae]
MTPGEAERIAEGLAPGVWPSADAVALHDSAERARALAATLDGLAETVTSAIGSYTAGDAIAGRFHEAVVGGLGRTAGADLPGAAERLRALGTSLDAYARTVTDTRQQMALIALIADRDARRAEVNAAVGDDTWRVEAAGTGRMALTAAGDDHTERSEDAGQSAGAPAATSGMMPMMPLGAMGAAGAVGAGVGGLAGARAHAVHSGVGASDLTWLRTRAERLQTTVPSSIAGWFRTAVGLGTGDRGTRVVVVGTNDPQPYQRAGVELADDEAITANGRPPELAILDHMVHAGVTPRAIAAATPMDAATISALQAEDVVVIGPRA